MTDKEFKEIRKQEETIGKLETFIENQNCLLDRLESEVNVWTILTIVFTAFTLCFCSLLKYSEGDTVVALAICGGLPFIYTLYCLNKYTNEKKYLITSNKRLSDEKQILKRLTKTNIVKEVNICDGQTAELIRSFKIEQRFLKYFKINKSKTGNVEVTYFKEDKDFATLVKKDCLVTEKFTNKPYVEIKEF